MASAKDPNPLSIEIQIRVNPKASRNEVAFRDGWKVWVTAPPVDGQANAAVVELLAKTFGVPKRSITILRGETGKDKLIAVEGISLQQALAKVGAAKLFD